MKTNLTLLLLLIISSTNAQIINFPDPNFKARLLTTVDTNNDGDIEVSEALVVTGLYLDNANISSIEGIEYFTNLTYLGCAYNPITSMDLSGLPGLTQLNIYYNQLTYLNITGLSNLQWCNCLNNQLTSLDLTGVKTSMLQCQNNQLTSLNTSSVTNLTFLNCSNNFLTSLDVNNLSGLNYLDCSNNSLTQLRLKNNLDEFNLNFSENPALQYICADEFQLLEIQDKIAQYGYTNCFANSFCVFNEGNSVYTIEGTVKYDELSDGCDASDISYPNLKLACSDGINSGNVYTNSNGEFITGLQSTTISITPVPENSTYFSVTPSTLTIPLSGPTSTVTQNFCITPNGSHPDLEISMEKSNGGESANYYLYTISFKNKGTNTQSGIITLTFDDNQQDFSSSTPAVLSSSTNLITWDFTDLKPFETGTIQVTFFMNLGTTLFDGDNLNYVTSASSSSIDETPTNNSYTLNEIYFSAVLANNSFHSFSDYFTIFPNPTQDLLYINTSHNVLIDKAIVYNLIGQPVLFFDSSSTDHLDVSTLREGSYILKIVSDKGTFTSKFIKY